MNAPAAAAALTGGAWRWRLAGAFATGAVLNLGFAPFEFWPLAILCPAALFALLRGLTPRRAAWTGACFAAGLFSFGTYWLYTSIHHFGQVPVWLTLILQAGLIAIMAVYSAALGWIANRFWPADGAARQWLVLPSSWLLLEWLRGWVLSGFPWLALGYAFTDSPLASWAPILGVYGLSWIAVMLAVALEGVWRPGVGRRARGVVAAVVAVLLLAPLGLSRLSFTRAVAAPIPVAVVQGAVPQDEKWIEGNREATLEKYAHLTAQQAWGARLVVWPEAAIPMLSTELGDFFHALREAGQRHAADFAIGQVRYDPQTDQYHNGLLVLTAQGEGWYYKRRLVPFGEFFPVPSFVRSWMRLMSLPYSDMTPGTEDQPILHAAGQPLGLTICYEDAYGSEQRAVLREATLLVNVTNNAWYGDSTAPHQHLQIARMRAIEAQRYLVRAANDGVSAVIGTHGEIIARLPQFQPGVLRAEVVPRAGLTPYARLGNYPVLLGSSLLLALAWRRRRAA